MHRLNVRSPKTEHHVGHERRQVPITPELMNLLLSAMDDAEMGSSRILNAEVNGNTRRILNAAIKRAEVEPWDDLFRTLRRSCEIEWALKFPQYVVSRWTGHSLAVSMRHYSNSVPDEVFDRAAGRNPDGKKVVLNPVQTTAKLAETESNPPEVVNQASGPETQNRPENSERFSSVPADSPGDEPAEKSGWLSWYRNDVAEVPRRGDGCWVIYSVMNQYLLGHERVNTVSAL